MPATPKILSATGALTDPSFGPVTNAGDDPGREGVVLAKYRVQGNNGWNFPLYPTQEWERYECWGSWSWAQSFMLSFYGITGEARMHYLLDGNSARGHTDHSLGLAIISAQGAPGAWHFAVHRLAKTDVYSGILRVQVAHNHYSGQFRFWGVPATQLGSHHMLIGTPSGSAGGPITALLMGWRA